MSGAVLITGSSRGIGLGAAEALAKKGFNIGLNSFEDGEEIDAALRAVREHGVKAEKYIFDVSDLSAHEGVLAKADAELGGLTGLVNNAGVSVLHRGDILDVTEESFDRCINVNTKAMFFLSQSFAKLLISKIAKLQNFYSIINVTSSNARAVAAPRSEYCVSKAAAAMASKAFAVRLGELGIHVYDVQPGLIATEMTKTVIDDYQKRAEDGLTLLPRIGTPEDMGAIIASLASGELPYVTGQVISADGGLLVERF